MQTFLIRREENEIAKDAKGEVRGTTWVYTYSCYIRLDTNRLPYHYGIAGSSYENMGMRC